jgi:rod shape-determining protein MreD
MKPVVYLVILLLLVPVQASLLAPLARLGLRPDLGLALLFTIGLITGPIEGALAGIAIGLVLDLSSASLLGLTALLFGILGLSAGLLGRRVLDVSSPSSTVFLAAFSIAQSLMIMGFLETVSGSVPVWSLLFRRALPVALATAVAGYFLLRFVTRRQTLRLVLRRELQKEL